MGVVANLSVTARRHDDGCLIVEWDYWSPTINLGDYRHLRERATVSEALQIIATWMSLVDNGATNAQDLYEEIELPLQDRPGLDV